MRSPWLFSTLMPCLAVVAVACATESPAAPRSSRPAFVIGPPPGCLPPFVTGGIQVPINADNSSSFQLGRTIPVKISVTDCATGAAVDTLAPNIALVLLGPGGAPVNEVVSSSAADVGTTMRSAGSGKYIFNLSTKRSQFSVGQDLIPGTYQLTISNSGQFTDVVVQFDIRP